jgi:hypothetical protein
MMLRQDDTKVERWHCTVPVFKMSLKAGKGLWWEAKFNMYVATVFEQPNALSSTEGKSFWAWRNA